MVQYISGRELIARIEFDISFDNTDWIAKAPLWIADCLALMDIAPALQPVYVDVAIVDNQCIAPLNIKILDGITIDNIPLTPHTAYNGGKDLNHALRYATKVDTDTATTVVEFGVETGTARFYYHIPAVEPIDDYNVIMPKVIDDIFVFETVKWFIVMKMLQRGYVHSIYTLKDNNPFTNVGLLWKEYEAKARNHVSTMNQAELKVLFDMQRELIKDYDYFYRGNFTPVIQ